jgi:hypothetical protein
MAAYLTTMPTNPATELPSPPVVSTFYKLFSGLPPGPLQRETVDETVCFWGRKFASLHVLLGIQESAGKTKLFESS